MTLAEQLVQHCASERTESFGALMGKTYPARELLAGWFGRGLRVAPGVELYLPPECRWQTYDQADGSVQISFVGTLPRVGAEVGIAVTVAELSSLVLRMGRAAIEVQAMLRVAKFIETPFTLTIPLT